jgi:hypothetical protein
MHFWSLSNIWTLPHMKRNYYLLLNNNSVLHSSDKTNIFDLSAFTSRPTFLLACNRASLFFLQYMSLFNILSVQTSSWCVPFSSNPSWFFWAYLMAYCKAKLKSNGNKASLCFIPFWTEVHQADFYLCRLY